MHFSCYFRYVLIVYAGNQYRVDLDHQSQFCGSADAFDLMIDQQLCGVHTGMYHIVFIHHKFIDLRFDLRIDGIYRYGYGIDAMFRHPLHFIRQPVSVGG